MGYQRRRKRAHDRSGFSTGRRDGPGTTHTTPATMRTSRPIPSLAESITTPSNSCHLPLEGDPDTPSDSAVPLHKVVPHCLRQCSHTSLPESQLECAKARMYDSEAECNQECQLQSCCHRQDDSTSAAESLTATAAICSHRKEEQSILLKNLKPQRSYSLRLGKRLTSKSQQEQDTSFSNGPTTTQGPCVTCQYKKASQQDADDAAPRTALSQSGSGLEASAESSGSTQYASCSLEPTQRSSVKRFRRRLTSESSSDSGCTDTRSELEEVIMTTAC